MGNQINAIWAIIWAVELLLIGLGYFWPIGLLIAAVIATVFVIIFIIEFIRNQKYK